MTIDGEPGWNLELDYVLSAKQRRFVRVNGQDAGETDLFAMRAGELGVPVGLITGDQVVRSSDDPPTRLRRDATHRRCRKGGRSRTGSALVIAA